MISRPWRLAAGLLLFLTALGFLATRLVFAPVPWADSSAFYLPSLDLFRWPPLWRMHAQAAFVPSYDEANFNLMPALPILLGLTARIGVGGILGPELANRALSLCALLAWAWLLWSWLLRSVPGRAAAAAAASALALAGLWDPVLRWGTLVVRTETWIGLCWLGCLRELHEWEACGEDPARWPRTAWRISIALAAAAYFHFEAVYFVPAAIVGLGFSAGWFKRLIGIGLRTTALLVPWLIYVACHPGLFAEQMQVQFFRLAHGNHWMANAYMIFHSMFIDHGSPAGWPKFFNVAKGVFWLGLLGLAALTVRATGSALKPRRALLASGVAFACCFYLWATKAEVWFITLCHLVFWPWAGAALIAMTRSSSRPLGRCAIAGLAGAYAGLALAASIVQARTISPLYTWEGYRAWVDCIERAIGPVASKPGVRLWQPHVPDVLVELSQRHPDWDLTRALDFPSRRGRALEEGERMDAVVFTRAFNGKTPQTYFGPIRQDDVIKLSHEEDLPFGPWALERAQPGAREGRRAWVCEVGPLWAVVLTRE